MCLRSQLARPMLPSLSSLSLTRTHPLSSRRPRAQHFPSSPASSPLRPPPASPHHLSPPLTRRLLMNMPSICLKAIPSPSRLKDLLLLLSLFLIAYLLLLLLSNHHHRTLHAAPFPSRPSPLASPLTRHNLLFSVASSSLSFPRRLPYLRLWYSSNSSTRAFAFLDAPVPPHLNPDLIPTVLSEDTSRFPYTFRGGLRSAIRVARIVKEVVDRNEPDVRWYVFGDDDTIFFVDNLVKVLSKYDHNRFYYIGSNSECYEQNVKNSFDMAFGGGGFAISASLASALAWVLDSCLVRYAHLYGSDARIFSCVAELGVGLTHEPGFHQVDMRGNLFGLLTAHPLSPLVSLHHLDAADPMFPNMNKTQALEHLFQAVNVDPARSLQQSLCYDQSNSLTISISWGYAVQVFEGNVLLPDLLSRQRTFAPWRRARSIVTHYMFNIRDLPKDACERPVIFFFDSILSDANGVQCNYVRQVNGDCARGNVMRNLDKITVFSTKLELDIEQMKAPRRQCCDVLPVVNGSMFIHIRQCGHNELISMHV